MENFIAYNPTKLYFGKGVVAELGPVVSSLGKKALLVYGKGSVLRNGSYHDTVAQLKNNNIEIVEFSGIKPNPVVSAVDEAAQLGISENVDIVVAVGGGSVIDSAKIIAVCIADQVKGWDVMTRKHIPVAAIPLVTVLTLAATGTEMNSASVLQNPKTEQKIGYRNELLYPSCSFLDPSYTQSVPFNYTAYGVVDLVAHSLEAWFGKGQANLSDKFVVSIIREAMEIGPLLMQDLTNYEFRERIMWAATCALNDTAYHGRTSGDWGVHGLGHILSYLYDTAHGATLSIFYPAWMLHIGRRQPERIVQLGKALFGTLTVENTAKEFSSFFKSLGSPVKAADADIGKDNADEILTLMNKNNVSGMNIPLDESDRKAIIELIMA